MATTPEQPAAATTASRAAAHLESAANEAAIFLTKAFRGQVDLSDKPQQRLLGAAQGAIGAWTRLMQTQSAREQTRIALAAMLADSEGKSRAEYLRVSLPMNPVIRAIAAPKEETE